MPKRQCEAIRKRRNTYADSAKTSAIMAAFESSASSASSICSSLAPADLARFFSTLGFRPASS